MITTPLPPAPPALIQTISSTTTVDSRCVPQTEIDTLTTEPNHPGLYVPVGYKPEWDHPVILVQNGMCMALLQRRDFWRLGEAIYVIGHERQHALGVIDEDQADCGSFKTFFTVAAMLGVRGNAARKSAQAVRGNAGYHPRKMDGCWTAASKLPTPIIHIK